MSQVLGYDFSYQLGAYLVLGFLLAWVVGLVAHEEIEVTIGAVILILTWVVSTAADAGLRAALAGAVPARAAIGAGVNFCALVLMTRLMAQLSWKHSVIIAAVYTGVLFVWKCVLG